MPLDVTVSTEIARPRAAVSAYAADPDHDPVWYANIREVTWHTPRPLVLGSRVARVARFLGRRMAYTYEVVAFVPGERVHMRADDGPFPMNTEYRWEDGPSGGTRMFLRNFGGPTGVMALATPLMAGQIRRETTADLARLKALLEADPG